MGIKIDDILGNKNNNILEDKSKKQINMLIIVIAVIVVIIVILAARMVSENRKTQLKDSLYNKLLDTQRLSNVVSSAYADYLNEGTPLVGRKLGGDKNVESINFNGTKINFEDGYYYISRSDTSKFTQLTLSNNDSNYIVNYVTGEVINQTGVEYNGKKYYFYEDMDAILKLLEGKQATIPSDYTIFISNANDMQRIKEHPNYSFKLISNIDMKGVDWTSVDLTGYFDGRNYTISNLTINRPSDEKIGLFSSIKKGATVSNLKLANVNINGGKYTGALAGVLDQGATIKNCRVVSGKVASSQEYAGGFFGQSNGTVEGAISSCEVTSDGKNVGGFAGEIIGGTYTKVGTKTSSNGEVTVNGSYNVGGLVGMINALNNVTFEECFAYANITAGRNSRGVIGQIDISEQTFNYNAGGFAGTLENQKSGIEVKIENAYARGTIKECDKNLGGFFGRVSFTSTGSKLDLSRIYTAVDTNADCDDKESRGGFVGYYNVGKSGASTVGVYWRRDSYLNADLNDSGIGKPESNRNKVICKVVSVEVLNSKNPFGDDKTWGPDTLVKWKIGSGLPKLKWEEEI